MSSEDTSTHRLSASHLDATLLKPGSTRAEFRELISLARDLSCASACIPLNQVPLAAELLRGSKTTVCTVISFPHGDESTAVKSYAAFIAARDGASEVDMVADLGAIAAGDWGRVEQDVAAVRGQLPAEVELRVILESAAWSPEQLAQAAQAALRGGGDWLKTSTGFHPAGGASVEAVAELYRLSGGGARVKASGGIRTAEQAQAMLAAGAVRIGTSDPRSLLGA